jgi:hypothetical protein
MIRSLEPAPAFKVSGHQQVGDRAVVPVGFAKDVRPILGDEPVADVGLGVPAEAVAPLRRVERAPSLAVPFQGGKRLVRRDAVKPVPAVPAGAVLEMERLLTALASKELH